MPRFNDTEFETHGEEIAQNIENTLDRVVNDYPNHWQGVIGEWIQNSYDGWCHNRFGRRVIPESQELTIRFEVNVPKRRFRGADNAGGMPGDVFYHNFAGLDTPGEEKQTGDFGGSYGRGSHVIAGAGEEMYAETNHDEFRAGLAVRGATQLRADSALNFTDQGTIIEVYDVDPEVLVNLTDWQQVHRYIQARFNPLLEHDNVTIEYVIDGEIHTVEPLDISNFDILWEGDLDFEYSDEEYTLHGVTIYDATSSTESIPIDGVAMLKSNAHMDRPFMRVQDYRPRQLRHLDKMFGFCDASELCPKYEDNAHNSFTSNIVSRTGLKELLENLEREHFIGTPTDLNAKDKIINTTLEIVNDQWDYNPFDDGTPDDTDLPDGVSQDLNDPPTEDVEVETEPDGHDDDDDALNDTTTDPDETGDEENLDDLDLDWAADDDDDENENKDELEAEGDHNDDDDEGVDDNDDQEPLPELSCSTRQRSFRADDDVTVWVFMENPSEYDNQDFTISGQLEHDDTGAIIDLIDIDLTVPSGQGSTGDDRWSVNPDDTGKYTFRATLHDTTESTRKEIDTTYTWFWVGRETTVDEQDVSTVSFLETIIFVRSDDEDFRGELIDGERGMRLLANTQHPEFKHAVSLDGRTGTKNQILTTVRWAHEAIITRLLIDELDDSLADMYTDNGDPLNEKLGGFVRENMVEHLSTLMAGAHDQL